MYIVDGFGRYKASQYIDPERYESLDVMVILNAPKDPNERLRFEAEQYAYQNRDVAKMRPIQKHGAMEILDDPAVKNAGRNEREIWIQVCDDNRAARRGSAWILREDTGYYPDERTRLY